MEDVDDVDAALGRYLRDLERSPLAVRTREAYGQHVRAYAAWLAGRAEPVLAIVDPRRLSGPDLPVFAGDSGVLTRKM